MRAVGNKPCVNQKHEDEGVLKSQQSRLEKSIIKESDKSRFIAPRKMILPPSDSSQLGDSKELLIIFLQLLDVEKLSKMFSSTVNINQETTPVAPTKI
ncbi:unnamed protein product [Rhizophagus irregularis]|nr:unnamed protein product [Rhizophagus irregularis]